jgi:SpoVK/Ycf46/Vps4 family AAA+-type ATPase
VTSHDQASFGDLPPQSVGHDAGYRNIIDVQFISRALDRRARCVRGTRWPTEALYPGNAPEVIASAYYDYSRSFEALATVEGVLAHIIRQGDTVSVRLAGDTSEALDRAESRLREQLPEPETDPAHEVAVDFSALTDGGLRVTTHTLKVPTFAEIAANYPSAIRRSLAELCRQASPGRRGRLLLWHGLPGCGKTWALRALASEWREWCKLRYVSDPERLFQDSSYLIEIIHMRPGGRGQDDRWQLIVLEDTGELFTADAKEQTGQGLSRLLNVADGLLGESSQALFLLTTNEDLRAVHPAVARPGRCAHLLEFDAFSAKEANRWLTANGCTKTVVTPTTLAELFALRDGVDLTPSRRRPLGFAPA